MTINEGVTVNQGENGAGKFSSLIENGWYNGNNNTGGELSVMTINGGTFSGGLNTIKNDDYGELTIKGGTFSSYAQASPPELECGDSGRGYLRRKATPRTRQS